MTTESRRPYCESDETDDSGADLRKRQLRTVPASSFKAKRVRWLLPNFIPLHMLTVLVGEEGIGKGLWWCWLAAELTNRGQSVMVIATEDHWEFMVRPRLEAAGADLERVFTVTSEQDGTASVMLPRDTVELSGMISERDIAALFIDPWVSVINPQLRVKDPQEARKALDPLIKLAALTPVTILAVVHPNRGEGSMRDRVGITAELRKAARSVLWVLTEPEGDVRYVGQEKTNLGPRGLPAHKFTVSTVPVPMDHDGMADIPRFNYESDDPRSVQQIDDDLRGATDPRGYPDEWLRLRLAEGPVSGDQIEKEAAAFNLSGYRLRDLTKQLGIVKKPGGFQQPWTWQLPDETAGQAQSRQSRQSDQSRQIPRVVVGLFKCAVCGQEMTPFEPGQTAHPSCRQEDDTR